MLVSVRRNLTRMHATVAFTLGCIAGGCVLGFFTYLLGVFAAATPPWSRASAIAGGFVVAIMRDLGWLRFPLPEYGIQIPQSIYRYGVAAGSFNFGVLLGLAVRTRIPGAFFYAFVLAVALGGFPLSDALIIGALFGTGRAAVALRRLFVPGRTGGVTQPTLRLAAVACGIAGTTLAASLGVRGGF